MTPLATLARRRAFLLAALAVPVARAQPARGWFGFLLAVESDGWALDPVIRSVTIKEVVPGSPAAAQRVAAGDRIIAIDGQAVAGRRARELQPHVEKAVGEAIVLRLQRPGGDVGEIRLVAVARPAPR
jgi:C-terminal processing protease CtpA/Prc